MRRLVFLLSCGVLVWILAGARNVARQPAPAGADTARTDAMIRRSQVVSAEFTTAFVRARAKAHRANDFLGTAANKLNTLAGD